MSLIEKYGSYEATKEKYQALSDSDMITIGPVEFSAKDYFEDELLEYRRENNLYEPGDKVVFVSEKMDFLDDDQIHSISVITENNLPKVCGLYVSFEVIKHATDEEIKNNQRGS